MLVEIYVRSVTFFDGQAFHLSFTDARQQLQFIPTRGVILSTMNLEPYFMSVVQSDRIHHVIFVEFS
ncbi:hypothetical protein NY2A_b459R [Paramecium bursaria Chlorella virus NY2A]|uniref:Uncharacterized protein b459R n=1 Tax=Paramecium bursaria Chlorella virus NY2A TaxID=46021 RepID=A7IWY4_PBCVN|nr:hypothetical protein NY2A_b459R [Paramecium bursaria Chlorella virus NY2A]ABT14858.1 hypothetical protein NY2A_b459R [Paramecium bursaria Chlorella virus NY2A]